MIENSLTLAFQTLLRICKMGIASSEREISYNSYTHFAQDNSSAYLLLIPRGVDEDKLKDVLRVVIDAVYQQEWLVPLEGGVRVGIRFEIADSQHGRCVKISLISKVENLLLDVFNIVNEYDDHEGSNGWATFLLKKIENSRRWLKKPINARTRFLLGNIPNLGEVRKLHFECSSARMPFSSLSIINLPSRPFDREIDLSGKYAVMVELP